MNKKLWLQIGGLATLWSLPAVATAFITWNLPVEKYQPSGYAYLGQHWTFGWIALALFLIFALCTWMSRAALRENVKNDLALLRKHGGMEVECPLKIIRAEDLQELRESGQLRLVRKAGA